MRRFLFIAIALALAVAVVHDVAFVAREAFDVNGDARSIAQAGADAADKAPGAGTTGWPAAYAAAQTRGVTVTGFSQTEDELIVDVSSPVSGTWIAGPVIALVRRQPIRTPITVTSHAEVFYR
jgi:hypothetical protein